MPAKHVHNDGKISALLIADASGANRFYVVAHCEGGGWILHHICQFRYYTFGQYFDNLSTAYKTCYDNDNLKKKFSM